MSATNCSTTNYTPKQQFYDVVTQQVGVGVSCLDRSRPVLVRPSTSHTHTHADIFNITQLGYALRAKISLLSLKVESHMHETRTGKILLKLTSLTIKLMASFK